MWKYLFTNEAEYSFDSQLLEYIKDKNDEQVEATLRDATNNLCTAVDASGWSLLHYAAECGNEIITKFLLISGAKVDLQNKQGQMPLILATKGEHEDTIRILLKHDADIYVSDNNGISALQLVVQDTLILPSVIEMFLNQLKIDCSGSKEIAEKLLKVNCPLYVAVRLQNVDVVKRMLSEGSPIDATDPKSNHTALHTAVQNKDVEMVKLLVDGGADVNALDIKKETPLSLIRAFDELEILKILVSNRTNLTSCTEDGFMQMYWVLTKGTCGAVKIVVQSEIDLRTRDSHDRNGIHYLANNVNEGVVEIVKKWVRASDDQENQKEPSRIRSMINAVKSIGLETIDGKLVDWNARDKDGRTALHNAMAAGNLNFVQYLIKKGVDVNVKTTDGVTPFFEVLVSKSALEQRVQCVKFIMQKDADPATEVERYLETHKTKSAINSDFPLLESVLAHLVIREAKGQPISEKILESIDGHSKLKDYIVACRDELDQMKEDKIYKSFTLFDFLLTDERKKMAIHIQNYSKFTLIKKYKFDSYYSSILRQRYSRVRFQTFIHFCVFAVFAILFVVAYWYSFELEKNAIPMIIGVALMPCIMIFLSMCFEYLRFFWASTRFANCEQVFCDLYSPFVLSR